MMATSSAPWNACPDHLAVPRRPSTTATAVEDHRQTRRARRRGHRAAHRVRWQRPAGRDDGRGRAHLHQSFSGHAGSPRGAVHQRRRRLEDRARFVGCRHPGHRRRGRAHRNRRDTAGRRQAQRRPACSPAAGWSTPTARAPSPASASPIGPDGLTRLPVDALAMSGGWNPSMSLTTHLGVRPRWNADIDAFVAGGQGGAITVVRRGGRRLYIGGRPARRRARRYGCCAHHRLSHSAGARLARR